MPVCRIYFFTYNRNYLIARSIQGLLAQTCKNWVCEVHNDLPGDSFPAEFISTLNDDRFVMKDHPVNLGGTGSFNLAFKGCEEKYATILEDDNWWEPTFLEEMIAIMDEKPELDIAWSNMRIWKEYANNQWEDTGKTVWPLNNDKAFNWPQPQHALGAIYSNGAMLYKGAKAPGYLIPGSTLFDAMEMTRERAFKHPVYLNSKILANFSVTSSTTRSKNKPWQWTACQAMQLSSFVAASGKPAETFADTLNYYRQQSPSPVANFFLANIYLLKNKTLYKYFTLHDWYLFSRWLVKTNFKLISFKKYLREQSAVYNFLLTHTRNRYRDNAS